MAPWVREAPWDREGWAPVAGRCPSTCHLVVWVGLRALGRAGWVVLRPLGLERLLRCHQVAAVQCLVHPIRARARPDVQPCLLSEARRLMFRRNLPSSRSSVRLTIRANSVK